MPHSKDALYQSHIDHLSLAHRGKVRDIYAVDNQYMLIVATDRISAFDSILPDPIPSKGGILTELSRFWFMYTQDIVANHLTDIAIDDIIFGDTDRQILRGRACVVRKLKPLPIEAVVRGYLAGSAWSAYQADRRICGIELPQGLHQSERLEAPLFTPARKARPGEHDENINFNSMIDLIGTALAEKIRELSLEIYATAAEYALQKGIIIADTKFEFGLTDHDELILMDELLTPDSSRFWPAKSYQIGTAPPSFDKQYIRDYLATLNWNKIEPAPRLPAQVIENTSIKYRKARDQLISKWAV